MAHALRGRRSSRRRGWPSLPLLLVCGAVFGCGSSPPPPPPPVSYDLNVVQTSVGPTTTTCGAILHLVGFFGRPVNGPIECTWSKATLHWDNASLGASGDVPAGTDSCPTCTCSTWIADLPLAAGPNTIALRIDTTGDDGHGSGTTAVQMERAACRTVGGRVALADGTPVPGITVHVAATPRRMDGGQPDQRTGVDGRFGVDATEGTPFTATPDALGWSFAPSTVTVTVGEGVPALDFTATASADVRWSASVGDPAPPPPPLAPFPQELDDIAAAAGGGGYMAGGSDTATGRAAWLVRVGAVGEVLWQRAYPAAGSTAASVAPAPDGGAIFATAAPDPVTTNALALVTVDAGGAVTSAWTYGIGLGSAPAVRALDGGGYAVRYGDGCLLVVAADATPTAAACLASGTITSLAPDPAGALVAVRPASATSVAPATVVAALDRSLQPRWARSFADDVAVARGYAVAAAWAARLSPDGTIAWSVGASGSPQWATPAVATDGALWVRELVPGNCRPTCPSYAASRFAPDGTAIAPRIASIGPFLSSAPGSFLVGDAAGGVLGASCGAINSGPGITCQPSLSRTGAGAGGTGTFCPAIVPVATASFTPASADATLAISAVALPSRRALAVEPVDTSHGVRPRGYGACRSF